MPKVIRIIGATPKHQLLNPRQRKYMAEETKIQKVKTTHHFTK